MLKRLALLIALLLIAAACSEEQPATTTGPEIVATTTAGPPETVPTTTSISTTAAPVETTSTTTSTTTTTLPISDTELQLTEIARGFEQPVLALSPPNDDRLFVVDQPGRIWVLAGDEPDLFLDLNEDVIFGGERGLLGMAFHPDFAENGRFFLNYIGDRGETRLVEVTSPDGLTGDPASQVILLQIEQPARNHNGGMIAFGPEGYLWVATGDGGAANDRFGQGQRPDTLLATLLRLDVSTPGEYSIPEDNPFAGGDEGAPEVYSFGLRNPWRFTIDGGVLYIADVGQRSVEEVNVTSIEDAKGANFGWPVFEGSDCFKGPCDLEGTELPAVEYSHSDGCSITGGFVYRGSAVPELAGHFFYGDYCSGWVRSLSPDGETFEWFGNSSSRAITSFGQDSAGEIYVVIQNGSIFKIERA